ncbi:MAG: thiamine pyrophosphate-binding protein [Bacteroidaceae bacterium]
MNNTENITIIVNLLKKHKVRYTVLSPGGTNIPLVSALQDDPYFKCFSVVDERSAMYFAIGLYLQTGEIIVTSCTSAQATRNYIPGLTEAFYKHVPILAITTSKLQRFVHQNYMQAPNQVSLPEDSVKKSFSLPQIKDTSDFLASTRMVNEAILELTREEKGPVQLNIQMQDFPIEDVNHNSIRSIERFTTLRNVQDFVGKKIMIVAGEHRPYTFEESNAIEQFAASHNCVIYTNHLSNICTQHCIDGNLFLSSSHLQSTLESTLPEIIISIGGQTGDYPLYNCLSKTQYNIEHWAISLDGKVVDTYDKLTRIYQMSIDHFFKESTDIPIEENHYFEVWKEIESKYVRNIEIPFSNAYLAQQLHKDIPSGSTVNLAILNSIRNWNLFPFSPDIKSYANVAAFGIDGCTSMLIGESVADDNLHFLVTGDLAFFYDLNAIGIREIKNNVRILLVNNNGGVEFKLGGDAKINHYTNRYIAASDHFKNAKGWVETCGFKYMKANSKSEFLEQKDIFIQKNNKPILFEVFTKDIDDASAYRLLLRANSEKDFSLKSVLKKGINNIKREING